MDAGQDLPVGAGAVIQGEFQQLVALFHRLAGLHLHRPEITFTEGIKVYALSGKRLQFDGGEGGLFCLQGDSLQFGKFLFRIDPGKQILSPLYRRRGGQGAPASGALPGLEGDPGAQLGKDLFTAFRHKGQEENSAQANGLQKVIEDPGKPGTIGLHILGKSPGGVFVNIFVGSLDDFEDLLQSVLELVVFHLLLIPVP